jgi:hypothetical protein
MSDGDRALLSLGRRRFRSRAGYLRQPEPAPSGIQQFGSGAAGVGGLCDLARDQRYFGGRGARVNHWNRTLARTPRIQPMIAAASTSQTSETRELPTSQST